VCESSARRLFQSGPSCFYDAFFKGFQFEVGGLLFSDYGYSLFALIRLRLAAAQTCSSNEQQLQQKTKPEACDLLGM